MTTHQSNSVNCCVGCERPIMDKYYPCIDDQIWHQDCLRCVFCRVQLVDRCFFRNGQYFCRNDFIRLFSPRCPTCLENIHPTDMVRVLGSVAYHADCLRCVLCTRCLSTGDECRPLGDGVRFVCLEHEAPPPPLTPAKPSGQRTCPTGIPESPFEEDSKQEPDILAKESHYYDHQDSYGSTDGGLGNFLPSEPEQERDLDSPVYTNNLEGDDRSEECGVDVNEIDGDNISKAPSGVEGGSIGSPASNGNSVSATTNNDLNSGNTAQGDKSEGGSIITKRRGPRTTIKAKQLDTLKQAFATTPKPTRHIREQLAQETGLSMRVIQVWFQNRRSKERRMKQLSALGVRRNFFQQQHVHHLAARRMRLSESECESRDAFGPDDLPPDVMAEILHMPLLQAPQQTQSYQSSLFCVDAQRDFYNAVVAEATGSLPMGAPSMFAYSSSPLPAGYQNPFNGNNGNMAYSSPHEESGIVKNVSPLSPQLGKPEEQISDSSVYFSDGCAYPLDKCIPASPSESFSQLVEQGFPRNAGLHGEHDLSSAAQDNFAHQNHPHPHNVQSSLSQQLTHLSPIRPQRGPVDHRMTSAVDDLTACCDLKNLHLYRFTTYVGIMWLTNFLCILSFSLILLLLLHHHPTLTQPVTGNISSNSTSNAQKSKRSLMGALAMADPPSLAGAGDPGVPSIDWRFSLGNPANTSHVNFTPQAPKGGYKRDNKASWRPQVTVIGDNLAVNLSWPSRNDPQFQLSHYRIQFRHREPHERRWARPFVVLQTRLSGNVAKPYMYVTNKQPGGLEAGKVYQFQVVAVYLDAETSEEKSRWSSTVSFDYISPEPPLFRVARRLPDGIVHLKWSRPWRNEDFKITRFIILFRKEKRLPGGETAFHGFQHITVRGNLEEYKVTGLDRDAGYQFVIYGEHTPEGVDPATSLFTGGLNGRKITAFSQEVFVPMDAKAAAAQESKNSASASSDNNNKLGLLDMNTNASNSLMFLILGVLAGAMLIVMVFLVAICFVRQRKEKLRLLARVNTGDKVGRTAPGTTHRESNGGVVSKVGSSVSESIGGGGPRIPSVIGSGGFLLAELTPIAVANFRTAPPPDSCSQQPPSSQPTNSNAGDSAGLGLLGEHDPLLLTTSPSETHHHSPNNGSNSGGTSSSIPSEFDAAAVADLKREPPSGGSIHGEESDGGDSGGGDRAQHTSMIPSPTREAVLFTTQISPFNYYPLALRNFHHNNRRPPSPALGSGLSRFGRARAYGYGYGHDQASLFGRLAPSHSFAYYPDAVTTDWLLRRRNSAGLGRFSPPPQRIQAIVPQMDGKVGEEIAEGMEFVRKYRSSNESSPAHRTKTPIYGISSERILPPRRRVSLLNQRNIFCKPLGLTEQADAYTQTTVSSDDARSYNAISGTPRSKRRKLSSSPSSPERKSHVDFVDSQKSSALKLSSESICITMGDLNQQV